MTIFIEHRNFFFLDFDKEEVIDFLFLVSTPQMNGT